MPFVSAHFGHWYISGPVYLSPVVLLVLWSAVTQRRDRRRREAHQREAAGAEPKP